MTERISQPARRVPRRIEQTLLNALKGGVVPRVGLPYITVGRKNEIEALLHDVEIISEGGASFRFLCGRYGSGKSFLLQTIRNFVMDRNFVVMDADLSPERRLSGTKGQGLATYRELVRNMAVKTRPEGGALMPVFDRWINQVQAQALTETGLSADDPRLGAEVEKRIHAVVRTISDLVHGFDFARLLSMYYEAYLTGNDELRAKVARWFRGEYSTKTEAKSDLGVNVIITDDNWYEYLKLFAIFFRQAGYAGELILIDELVNLYRIPNAITRQNNYEKILTMYNDTLQGKAQYLGIIMCATPQCMEDRRRGVYSYEALRTRLSEGHFSREGSRDLLAPVIRLESLSPEEMLVLTGKLADMHADLYGYEKKLTDEDFSAFIKVEYGRIGADSHITPREVIRDFIEILDILYQHPERRLEDLFSSDEFSFAKSGAVPGQGGAMDGGAVAGEDDFAEFTI